MITVTCYEHKCRINTPARRQQLSNELFERFIHEEIEILAWVILPNHYHLLIKNVEFKLLSQLLRQGKRTLSIKTPYSQ
ncbi:MAG: transposase [Nostocaceae cyanobacterium]|nr:transposase [Nostocaceae cyanobacterium]